MSHFPLYIIRLSLSLRLILLASIVLLLEGCASSPDIQPPVMGGGITSHVPVVNYALSLKGAPYRYGKSSPEEGFDCSGFVQHVYKRYGVLLPRTASSMASALPSVPRRAISPGDLVFFDTNGRPYSHVGIYIKDQQFIHAPSQRTGRVTVSSLNNTYWQKHYTGARRPR